MTAICAVHNKSQGRFIALQQILLGYPEGEPSIGLKRVNHFNS